MDMTKLHPLPLWANATAEPGSLPGAEHPRLTPYLPAGHEPTAVIVVCPGGGYQMRAPHEAEPVARWLTTLGVAACVLDYRVAPHRHPIPLGDAQRAVRLVRRHAEEWRIDPQRVGILGFSAGGHLASTAGTLFDDGDPTSPDPVERLGCRPDLMVLCYPVITFGPDAHQGSWINLLGTDAPQTLRNMLSTETQVGPRTPPAFLWHTADDEAVPVANSLLFAAALARHGVPFEAHIFESGVHGLGLATGDPHVGAWTGLCARWLMRQGFGSGPR